MLWCNPCCLTLPRRSSLLLVSLFAFVSLFVFVSLSAFVSLCLCVSLCLGVSLCLCLSLCLCPSLFLFVFILVFLCLCLYLCLSLPWLFLCLCLCICLSFPLSLSAFVTLYLRWLIPIIFFDFFCHRAIPAHWIFVSLFLSLALDLSCKEKFCGLIVTRQIFFVLAIFLVTCTLLF